jgi:hypothetical protein
LLDFESVYVSLDKEKVIGKTSKVRRAKSMILPIDKTGNLWYSYGEAKFDGRFITTINKDI